jgi:hypothetical protein
LQYKLSVRKDFPSNTVSYYFSDHVKTTSVIYFPCVDQRLTSIAITEPERIDCLPLLLNDLANALADAAPQMSAESFSTAAVHDAERAAQGYSIPLLVAETRILNRVIASVPQENLISVDLSTLVPDALKVGEYLQALPGESIRAFQAAETAPARKFNVKVG